MPRARGEHFSSKSQAAKTASGDGQLGVQPAQWVGRFRSTDLVSETPGHTRASLDLCRESPYHPAMLRSMTGFGVGRAQVDGEELTVELKSVNHKFCEVKTRLPRELAAVEPEIVKTVKERLARGAVEVFVRRSVGPSEQGAPVVDVALAKEYRRAFSQIAQALGVSDDVKLRDIAQQAGVIRLDERPVDLVPAQRAIGQALEAALAGLIEMRRREGEATRADLLARLAVLEATAAEIAERAPRSVDEYRQRLTDRIAELSRGTPVDPARLAQEVAVFAERTDIAEELSRFASHLSQFRKLIESPEPSGRKMDFLVQEMHREINTTGSKSQHAEISIRVVTIKAELERVREQVQNVE